MEVNKYHALLQGWCSSCWHVRSSCKLGTGLKMSPRVLPGDRVAPPLVTKLG